MPEALNLMELAAECHMALPDRIRGYLNRRGIADSVVDLHLLGWNGERITIPIPDREGYPAFFKLAKDPEDTGPGPKMLTPRGQSAELYGWERVLVRPCQIVICEGEFDRLVLETNGIAAVTSTGGAGVFKSEWADALREIPQIYISFDRDDAGRNGAVRVGRMIPHARIVELPEDVGAGGDVTDFFVRLRRGRDDFEHVLQSAKPLPEEPPKRRVAPRTSGFPSLEVAKLKEQFPVDEFIAQYVLLRKRGKTFVGRCPFHEDEHPSFVVHPETRSYHCFGCHAHGDIISFLMKVEQLTFPEAVQTLQRLAA